MEIELNFRLDADGRTANPNVSESKDENANKTPPKLDYSSKSIMTNLNSDDGQWLDDLLFDCEISDSGLMPRTFWVPVEGMEPRCSLEQFALQVFHHHVPSNMSYDPKTSGAEWWCQIRPSPEAGRYSMHDESPDEISTTGISFHWDKDEDLRLLMGGSTFLHPHLSTVTYLTDFGSPTLVANCRVNNLTGDWIVPADVEGFVSWPKRGKHMSFDGRYLHAALPELMEDGAFKKQIQFQESDDPKEQRVLKRRHRRVTFLVNIWLNYRPFNVNPFPETMLDKLSGSESKDRKGLDFQSSEDPIPTKCVSTSATCVKDNDKSSGATLSSPPTKFQWPMGDCNSEETIKVSIPLELIRNEASGGGNIQITWETKASDQDNTATCFGLYKGGSPSESAKREKIVDEEKFKKSTKRAKTE